MDLAPETVEQPTEPQVKVISLAAALDLSIQVSDSRVEFRFVMRPAAHAEADVIR